MKLNVGGIDRVIRILAGAGLVGWASTCLLYTSDAADE